MVATSAASGEEPGLDGVPALLRQPFKEPLARTASLKSGESTASLDEFGRCLTLVTA